MSINENESDEAEKVHDAIYGAQFEKAAGFSDAYSGLIGELCNESLKPIVTAFVGNLDRLRATAMLPGRIATTAGLVGAVATLAIDHSTRPKPAPDAAAPDHGPSITGFLVQVRQRLIEQGSWDGFKAQFPELANSTSIFSNFRAVFEKVNVHASSLMAKLPVKAVSNGLHGILCAQIIGAWTAYETLAGDMWISAVNEKPRALIAKMTPPNNDEGNKWISFNSLSKHGFDLTGKMGTVLAEKKVSFKTLDDIKKAYLSTFKGIHPISEAFNNTELDVIHAVRNVLVHRGGIVDGMFRDRMQNKPPWNALELGNQIPIDGELAANLTNTAITSATALVQGVDNWLSTSAG